MAEFVSDSTKTTQIYVRWSVDGQFIRKWSREPFADGEPLDAIGRAATDGEALAWRLERIIEDGGPLTLSDKVVLREAVTSLSTRAAPPAMDREAVDFLHQLRRVNEARYDAWVGGSPMEPDAAILFDANELGGECGELLNVVKKLVRENAGWAGSRAAPEDFADECADVLICLDKLARRGGVDLIAATTAKFNATSEKVGLPHKLSTLSADAIRQGEGWQDIGCAPKDGTDILAWSEEYGVRQTRMGRYTPGSPGFAAWERGDGPLNHGWVWIEEKHNSAHSWKPTHWMPLPATPASHASDGGKA